MTHDPSTVTPPRTVHRMGTRTILIAVVVAVMSLMVPAKAQAAGVSPDLFFIKSANTSSGKVEVHSATAASGYTSGIHAATYFSTAEGFNGTFQMVGNDLYFIKTSNTSSGKVEVHSATAASGYKSGIHAATYFGTADGFNGKFQMVWSDLYFIKLRNTASNKIEVHSATAGSSYQYGRHAATYFAKEEATSGYLQVVAGDLFFIKGWAPASGKIEVHSATAASGYRSGSHAATYFSSGEWHHGDFHMFGTDLFFTKKVSTGSGRIEVHSATVGTGYQSGIHASTYFSPNDVLNGTFQIGPLG